MDGFASVGNPNWDGTTFVSFLMWLFSTLLKYGYERMNNEGLSIFDNFFKGLMFDICKQCKYFIKMWIFQITIWMSSYF